MSQKKLGINFVFNVMGRLIPIAIALVTVPVYISYIGTARYGVLSIVWVVLGYFGFLDFGLSQATTNALAKLSGATKEERAGVFLTSFYLNLLLGVAGGIVIYFAGGLLLRHLLNLSDLMSIELQMALPWIACILPLTLLAGVTRGAIQAHERFFELNVLDLIGFTLGQFLPILFIIACGPSLAVVIPGAFLARAISVGLNFGWVIKIERPATFRVFDRSRLKELLGFGAWVTVTNVISPLLMSIDQLLVGSVLGAVAVAHYAVPMNLITRLQVVALALAMVLFPRFSRIAPPEAMQLSVKAVISLGFGFGAICGPAIIIGAPFLKLWLGSDFASHATPVFELLLIGAWINGIAIIPYSLLQGQGRPDLVAKLHVIEVLPFIAVLWMLLHQFGLFGAALAWTVRVTIDAALLFWVSRFPPYQLLRLSPALLLLLASYFVTPIANISLLCSVLIAGLSFLSFAASAIILDVNSRQMLQTLRARFLQARRMDDQEFRT